MSRPLRLALVVLALAALGGGVAGAAVAKRKPAACAKRKACRAAVLPPAGGDAPQWRHAGLPRRAAPGVGAGSPAAPASGGSDGGGGGGAAPPPPPPPPPAAPENRRFLAVATKDGAAPWRLTPSRTAVAAGAVTVEFNNRTAEDPHDLRFKRGAGTGWDFGFEPIDQGDVATQSFAFAPGTYRIFCSLPFHAAAGMETEVTVAG